MESPRPVPRRLVENNGRKRRSRISSVNAVTGIGDHDLRHGLGFIRSGLHREHAQQAALHGLGRVVDQIAKARFIASGSAITGGKFASRRSTSILSSRPAKSKSAYSRRSLFRSVPAAVARRGTRPTPQTDRPVAQRLNRGENHFRCACERLRRLRYPAIDVTLRMRSAERAMGVRGFLISCATRWATSFHAICFCARRTRSHCPSPQDPLNGAAQLVTVKIKCHGPRELCASISVDAAGMRRLRRRTRVISDADSVGNSD